MATPGELITAIANILGIPEVTVASYYRSLREGGLVTKGGRGLSAPKMTTRDAVHLLLACGGARFERESAASVVRDYIKLRAAHSARWRGEVEGWLENDEGVWILPMIQIPQLQALPPHHTFDDAFTALIEAFIAEEEAFKKLHLIEVVFSGPKPASRIRIDFVGTSELPPQEEETQYLLPENSEPYNRPGDLSITRSVTGKTIHAIADLLRGASR